MTLGAKLTDTIRTRGRGLKNAFARRSDQRLVVLESDDWGSQRVPSKAAMERLVQKGILSGQSVYDREPLESAEDLNALASTLASVRDSAGQPAVFTCFVNPANPDFEKIREGGFGEYFWEATSQILERRGDRGEVEASWRFGREAGLLDVEYHGREHIQVRLWLEYLRSDPMVRAAFDESYYSVPVATLPSIARGFRAAYFFQSESEIPALENIVEKGAQLFVQEYGRMPNVFCPPNNVFHPKLYAAVKRAGCRCIIRHTRNVQPDGTGGQKTVWGQRGVAEAGLLWYGRNGLFEPELGFGVGHTLGQIRSAFDWGVPAIISTHRVNYVGGIDPAVRERGTTALKELLKQITTIWPDVRFLSSQRLLEEFGSRG